MIPASSSSAGSPSAVADRVEGLERGAALEHAEVREQPALARRRAPPTTTRASRAATAGARGGRAGRSSAARAGAARRRSSAGSGSSRARSAASSIASGSPSRRAQIALDHGVVARPAPTPAAARRTRALNSAAAFAAASGCTR